MTAWDVGLRIVYVLVYDWASFLILGLTLMGLSFQHTMCSVAYVTFICWPSSKSVAMETLLSPYHQSCSRSYLFKLPLPGLVELGLSLQQLVVFGSKIYCLRQTESIM